MKLDQLTKPGWEDVTDKFDVVDEKYEICERRVPTVIELHMGDGAATPPPTTLGKHMWCLHNVPRIYQMLQGTFRPECSQLWQSSGTPDLNIGKSSLAPTAVHDSTIIVKSMPVDVLIFYPPYGLLS